MDSEHPEKGQQDPGEVVIDPSRDITAIRTSIHRGNEECIDNPADQKHASREKPNGPRDWLAVVKSVNPKEAEKPTQIADHDRMRVWPSRWIHVCCRHRCFSNRMRRMGTRRLGASVECW